MSFVHLHVHTHYSLLESTIKVSSLLSRAKELEMPAVAMTDLGNMFGAVDFYLAAKNAGIKPIIGAEIYYTAGSRFQKSTRTELQPLHHLVLLCKNEEGYRNLCELVSKGYTEGFQLKPRVDRELIEKYTSGLIALSAGLKGEVAFHCVKGNSELAQKTVLWLREIFKENFYLEFQENGFPEQMLVNRMMGEFAEKYSIAPVATTDVHYLHPKEAIAHEVLMCIGEARNLDENKATRLTVDEFWFKDAKTISEQFQWLPQAVENTLAIANQCHFSFKLKDSKGRPIYHLPEITNAEGVLKQQARLGLKKRFEGFGFKGQKEIYEKRLEEELDMIIQTGFAGYFLIVADFIGFAKSKKIPVGPGRGSGAGSLVAYALQITDIDPIPFNLLFERFINPERISMPDFDIDFCQNRRSEVIDYVVGKYGADKVSQIITFGKLLARGVIRDVGRVLNMSYAEVDSIAKLVPEELGITLEQALEKEPRLQQLVNSDPKIARLFEIAQSLEGVNRHASVHAAGVVITNKPLVEYCPLYLGKENEFVVQYDKDFAEKIGLVKFDFLGLKTLTVIDNAIKFIHEIQRAKDLPEDQLFCLDRLDYMDPLTYKLISNGDTDGIFQLESSGMKDLCMRVQPNRLEDITAINALYRPGPLNSGMVDDFIDRKHGIKQAVYELSQLSEILAETYGVIVYQEQVMRIARVLAGYSLGEADILRRAMGKKKIEEMAQQRDKFVQGCAQNKISEEKATKIFELLAKFAEYGFNKSHSAAYGVLSFQTAYLKAHFPAPFMAALMTTEMDNTDKMAQYISDARRHGIEVLPPDINQSQSRFSVVELSDSKKSAIRFGLEAIKGVGGIAVEVILAERFARGSFKSFLDFCTRVPNRKVNKKVIESLISAGTFDQIAEENRATLFENIQTVTDYASKIQEEESLGQVSMFNQYQSEDLKIEMSKIPLYRKTMDWSENKKLQLEKQLVGFYVSGHPIEKVQTLTQAFIHGDLSWIKAEFEKKKQAGNLNPPPATNHSWKQRSQWDTTTLALVSSFREVVTKKGLRMAFVELEDAKTKIEAVCFPESYEQCKEKIKQSVNQCLPFIILGSVIQEGEGAKLFIRSLDSVEEYQNNKINVVVLKLNYEWVNVHLLAQLRALLIKHRGKCTTYLEYSGITSGTSFESRHVLPKDLFVAPSIEMIQEINHLFGKDVVCLR